MKNKWVRNPTVPGFYWVKGEHVVFGPQDIGITYLHKKEGVKVLYDGVFSTRQIGLKYNGPIPEPE